MSDGFKELINQDDVVSVSSSDKAILQNSTFRVSELTNGIKNMFSRHSGAIISKWLSEGVECEVLQLGATSWRKGTMRLKFDLEFCPDEPDESQQDSPLDELRQIITEG